VCAAGRWRFGDAAGLLFAGAHPGGDGGGDFVVVEAAGLGGGGELFDDVGFVEGAAGDELGEAERGALRVWLRVPLAAVATFSSSGFRLRT
jgi:hypothetical protein